MLDYLKLFEEHADYETYIGGQDVILPNVSYCEDNNEVHYNSIHNYSKDYLTFVALEDGTFQLSRNAVSYSLDNGKTWTELAAATASPTVTAGKKIMWKGELTPASSQGIGTFSATAEFDVQGNPMSLLFGDNFKGQTDLTGKDYAFESLFHYCVGMVNAKNLSLSANTLVNSCYDGMFFYCTSLTSAPELPAETLADSCYKSMFNGCTGLVNAPALPATTLANYCYEGMFYGCTSLVNAPVLPVTTLAEGCYREMFRGCTSLVTAPELPATTLANDCYYYMFYGCTSLTEVAIVPNSVKPVSSDYCCSMYQNSNVPRSNDYNTVAYDGCNGGND